jgi:hypothetical protein
VGQGVKGGGGSAVTGGRGEETEEKVRVGSVRRRRRIDELVDLPNLLLQPTSSSGRWWCRGEGRGGERGDGIMGGSIGALGPWGLTRYSLLVRALEPWRYAQQGRSVRG